jgi:hypothetical protein
MLKNRFGACYGSDEITTVRDFQIPIDASQIELNTIDRFFCRWSVVGENGIYMTVFSSSEEYT